MVSKISIKKNNYQKRSLTPEKDIKEISFNKLLKKSKTNKNPSVHNKPRKVAKFKNKSFLYFGKFNKRKQHFNKNSIVSFEVKSPFLEKNKSPLEYKKKNTINFKKDLMAKDSYFKKHTNSFKLSNPQKDSIVNSDLEKKLNN
jgi:hypothetical protein